MADEPRRDEDSRETGSSGDDHVASRREIARLTEEVLPALIGRLGASDLAELEVREGDWRVRLRKPAGANGMPQVAVSGGRSKRRGRQQAQSAQAGAQRPTPPASSAASGSSGNGARPQMAAVGPGRAAPEKPRPELARRAAVSPAVGYYLPNEQITPGHRVHAGDLLGHIDVLGVRQDVVAPADGVVGRLLAQSGEAVEYGQELLRIDLVPAGQDRAGQDRGGIERAGSDGTGPDQAVAQDADPPSEA